MAYPFLSEGWIEAAREIRAKYEDRVPAVVQSVRINQVITDVPFGDGTIHAFIDSSEGSLDLELGQLEEPDAVVMTDYETARAMFVGRDAAFAMQAFMEGRIKVQGDIMKLMAMQAALPAAGDADELAAEIQAITE